VQSPICEEGSSSGHRLWLSSDEIEALVATHRDMSEEDKQTHILIQQPIGDSEIEGVLGMLVLREKCSKAQSDASSLSALVRMMDIQGDEDITPMQTMHGSTT
jgi:hypothetical protein